MSESGDEARALFMTLDVEQRVLNFMMYMEQARRLNGLGDFPPGVDESLRTMIRSMPQKYAVNMIIVAHNFMVQARDRAGAAT